MSGSDERSDRLLTFGQPGGRCCAAAVSLVPVPRGSRRKRIWELDSHAHCPVVGVCLPAATAARVAVRAWREDAPADEYELHCRLVAECKSRLPVAELVQKALEELHAGPVRQATGCKTADALADWWRMHSAGAGLPGSLWAVLTHARCTPEVELRVLGEVHMRQHQLGFEARTDQARLHELERARAMLAAEQTVLQARAARRAEERAAERLAWQADVVRLRGQLLCRDTLIAQLHEEAEAARSAAPDLPSRQALTLQLQVQNERLATLQRALTQAHEVVARLQDASRQVAGRHEAPSGEAQSPAPSEPAEGRCAQLRERTVLCVGGRTSAVPVYRELLERLGARFEHHDGGQEQGPQRLQACLAAADLVICQAGCVSHDAYWRVKEHCKRTGKRCVFVDTPSASSLQRALRDLLARDDGGSAAEAAAAPGPGEHEAGGRP